MTGIVQNAFTVAPGTVQAGVKRVRAYSQGELVVDAVAPLLVWEHPYFPQYFFLESDLEAELRPKGHGPRSKVLGPSELFDVVLGTRVVRQAASRFPDAPVDAMRAAVTLSWSAFDTWLEEDQVVHTHPRSPYVRIDARSSGRER